MTQYLPDKRTPKPFQSVAEEQNFETSEILHDAVEIIKG